MKPSQIIALQGTNHMDRRQRLVEVVEESEHEWIATPIGSQSILKWPKYAWKMCGNNEVEQKQVNRRAGR